MDVLIVCSGNSNSNSQPVKPSQPFIAEQCESLKKLGVNFDFFLIQGKGAIGYIKNLRRLRKTILSNNFDLIHAHFGLSGLLAVMQRILPVVTTFHGCDVNKASLRFLSRVVMRFAKHSIFVSSQLAEKARVRKRFSIIPCGVDSRNTFFPLDMQECRKKLNVNPNARRVLFASTRTRVEKNYALAREAIDLVGDVELAELMNVRTREEVNQLLNASDVLLLTSVREGSPQVIKEAMACNRPIVSTDVGDVRETIDGLPGCYITSFDVRDVANNVKKALSFGRRTRGRERIKHLGLEAVAKRVLCVYEQVVKGVS